MKKIAIIAFTENGNRLAIRMEAALTGYEVQRYTTKKYPENGHHNGSDGSESHAADGDPFWQAEAPISVRDGLQNWCKEMFSAMDALIFIGAAGIAVRTIAPFVASKTSDPAVLVSDEKGLHLISLLSGHLGGGNELTCFLASAIGADPVITTASDVNGKLAVDVWAQKNDLVITDMKAAKQVAADIVAGKTVPFFCEGDVEGEIPAELKKSDVTVLESGKQLSETISGQVKMTQGAEAILPEKRNALTGILVSPNEYFFAGLHLVPKCVILGIGCKKDKDYETIRERLEEVCSQYHISLNSIGKMVSIDRKAEEPGLLRLSQELGIPFETYTAEELLAVPGEYTASAFVAGTVGVDNVCERSSVRALPVEEQDHPVFLCRKQAGQGVTIAMTMKNWRVSFE